VPNHGGVEGVEKKAANLPVEQPKKFEFVINLKAPSQIGVNISPTCWRERTG
jgi:hypothetical protein